MQIKDIVYAMREVAGADDKNTVTVDKAFWLRVAALLEESNSQLQTLLEAIEKIAGEEN